ncbi:MAG: class I SAM-dependent methyltransferase, partial [Patescibacteria group bacterium]
VTQISSSAESSLILEDFHNFGAYYDLTLMAWFKNFDKSWYLIKNKYSERFYRMWKFYLLSCAGAFRARDVQLWQLVFSKNGVNGVYETVR